MSIKTNVSTCSVKGCIDRQRKRSFFRFPREPKIREIWISRCGRDEKDIPDSARVCSDHFAPEDYKKDYMQELMPSYKARKTLVPGTVPTLKLPNSVYNKLASLPNISSTLITYIEDPNKAASSNAIPKYGLKIRSIKSINRTDHDHPYMNTIPIIRTTNRCVQTDPVPTLEQIYKEKIELQEKQILKLTYIIDTLEGKYSKIKPEKLMEDNKELIKEVKALKLIQFQHVQNKPLIDSIKELMTPMQVRVMSEPKLSRLKLVHWQQKDYEQAYELHTTSVNAYRLLKKRGFPLPCESSLRRWVRTKKKKKDGQTSKSDQEEEMDTEEANMVKEGKTVIVYENNSEDENFGFEQCEEEDFGEDFLEEKPKIEVEQISFTIEEVEYKPNIEELT